MHFFSNTNGILSPFQELDRIFFTDRVEVADCDGRKTENGQGVYVHLWVLISNEDKENRALEIKLNEK